MLSPFLTNENKCPDVYFTTDFVCEGKPRALL